MRLLPTPGGRPHTRGVSSVETRDHERAALRQRGGAHGRVDEVPHGGVALQRVCVQLSRHLHPTQCGLPPPSTADCEQAGASCGRKRLSRYPSAEQVHGEPDVRNPSAKYQATLSLSLSLSLRVWVVCGPLTSYAAVGSGRGRSSSVARLHGSTHATLSSSSSSEHGGGGVLQRRMLRAALHRSHRWCNAPKRQGPRGKALVWLMVCSSGWRR